MLFGILTAACGVVAVYALIAAFLYFRQTGLIHIPYTQIVSNPADLGFEYEDVWLDTSDGAQLHGWFIPYPDSKHTVLIFHGNAGNISYLMETYQMLHDLGVSVLTYDYRSYGNSVGELTEDAMYQDAEAMFDYLLNERGISGRRIVLMGRSLGTAMASWVASTRKPGGLIMESSFTSMVDLARKHYPLIPTTPLLKWRYDSLSRIELVSCPVLYIHSREDTLTPFEQGVALFEATRSRKSFVEISGSHETGFAISEKEYLTGMKAFFDSLN